MSRANEAELASASRIFNNAADALAANELLRSVLGSPPPGSAMIQPHEYHSRPLNHFDLRSQYIQRGRSLSLPGGAITLRVVDDRTHLLTGIIAPIMLTHEKHFSMRTVIPHITAFQTGSERMVPRRQQHSTVETSQELVLAKQAASIESHFARDPNFGEQAYAAELAQLGDSALMTLNLAVAERVLRTAYARNHTIRFHSQDDEMKRTLHAFEENAFCSAALDTPEFIRLVEKAREEFVPSADTVILSGGLGGRIVDAKMDRKSLAFYRVEEDPDTREIMEVVLPSNGATVGEHNGLAYLDMPTFHITPEERLPPLGTRIRTLASAFSEPEFDHECGEQGGIPGASSANDIRICSQAPHDSRQVILSHIEAVKHSGIYGPDGKPSAELEAFADALNSENASGAPPSDVFGKNRSSGLHEERRANNDQVLDEADISSDHAESWDFRNTYGLVTFDATKRAFVVPQYVGDFHRSVVTPEVLECAAQAVIRAGIKDPQDMRVASSLLSRTLDLFAKIDAEVPTDEYLAEIRKDLVSRPLVKTPKGRAGDHQMRSVEEFGGGHPKLPRNENASPMRYPTGFSSVAGLRAMARAAGTIVDTWAGLGEAKAIVEGWDRLLVPILRTFAKESRLLDPRETASWFHQDDPLDKLVSYFVQLTTGRKQLGPVFFFKSDDNVSAKVAVSKRAKDPLYFDLLPAGLTGLVEKIRPLGLGSGWLDNLRRAVVVGSEEDQLPIRKEAFATFVRMIAYAGEHLEATLADHMTTSLYTTLAPGDAALVELPILKDLLASLGEISDVASQVMTYLQRNPLPSRKPRKTTKGDPPPPFDSSTWETFKTSMKELTTPGTKDVGDDPVGTNITGPVAKGRWVRSALSVTTGLVQFIADNADAAEEEGMLYVATGSPATHFATISEYIWEITPDDTTGITTALPLFSYAPRHHHFALGALPLGAPAVPPRKTNESERTHASADTEAGFAGPWNARYQDIAAIDDELTRIVVAVLIHAPNTMRIHETLTKNGGARLFKALWFRPAQQLRLGSAVVMKRGRESCVTAVSPVNVVPTQDGMGDMLHISCSFYYAVVEVNSRNFILVPDVVPVQLVRGMTAEITNDVQGLFQGNHRLGCMFPVLYPLQERHEFPLHLQNKVRLPVAGQYRISRYQKQSAAQWICYLATGSVDVSALDDLDPELNQVDDEHGHVDLLVHRGVNAEYQPLRKKWGGLQAGTGPLGNVRMHAQGANRVFDGSNPRFPSEEKLRTAIKA